MLLAAQYHKHLASVMCCPACASLLWRIGQIQRQTCCTRNEWFASDNLNAPAAECVATVQIAPQSSCRTLRVRQILEGLREMRCLPASVVVDSGPKVAGKVPDAWAYETMKRASSCRSSGEASRGRVLTSKASTGYFVPGA
jgi:hypothetical protein